MTDPKPLDIDYLAEQICQYAVDQLDYSHTWCDSLTRDWFIDLFKSWLKVRLPEVLNNEPPKDFGF